MKVIHERSPTAKVPASSAITWLKLALVASAVLPLALLGATAMLDYGRVTEQARERVHKTASIAQEHALKVLETSEVILTRVLDLLGDDDDAHIAARQAMIHLKLAEIQRDIEQVQNIIAWNREGYALVSSRYHPVPAVNVSDREDFAVHLKGVTGTHVTPPLIGRTSGDRVFNISRRRDTPDGRFAGTVTVSLRPDYFSTFYRELSTSRGELSIAIWRQDGVLLARYPDPRRDIRLPGESALSRFIASGASAGEARSVSPLDGVERIYSFRKIGSYPLYVSAGLEHTQVMVEWYGNLKSSALFAIAAALGMLGVTWIALKKTRREQSALAQWREEAERRASAEEALRQAQKLEAIGQLTGGVAHDFNNLLQVISTNVYILKLKTRGAEVEPQIAAITRALTSGETLTKHLLTFSRRRPLQPRAVPLEERLEEMQALIRHTLRGDITFRCDAQPGLWPISADPEELDIALLNIAVNARDAMPTGGSLTLHVRNVTLDGKQARNRLRGDYVAIAIRDTGHGIPAEIRERVFEPFFTTKEVGKGTGLGLSQVYGFAVQSGGAADIESTPGSGTTVTLYLPRAEHTAEARSPTHEVAGAEAASGQVLLVEDNQEIGDAVSAVMREMGYTVRHVGDADRALASIHGGERYDLLVTDIVMPGSMNGLELARTVRREQPQMPVLLMSGYTAEADKAAAEGYRILSKPFRPEALAEAIRGTRRPAVRTVAASARGT